MPWQPKTGKCWYGRTVNTVIVVNALLENKFKDFKIFLMTNEHSL